MSNQSVTQEFPIALDELQVRLDAVREAKHLFGVEAAKKVWEELGLPSGRTMRPYELRRKDIDQFLEECTVARSDGEVLASDLYKRYLRWQPSTKLPKLTKMAFGKAMAASGIRQRKSNARIYVGIELDVDPLLL